MDVYFEISKDECFMIEIGYFDTVLEIKEKIQKYKKIDIARQTLIFNGEVLVDDRDTEYYSVLLNSRIQLIVQPEPGKPKGSGEEAAPHPMSKLHIVVKILANKKQFSLVLDANDSIGMLMERVHQVEPLSFGQQFVIFFMAKGNESITAEYAVLFLFPPHSPSVGLDATNSKKLRLVGILKCVGARKVEIIVNASDNIGNLKKELQRLQQHINVQLLSGGACEAK